MVLARWLFFTEIYWHRRIAWPAVLGLVGLYDLLVAQFAPAYLLDDEGVRLPRVADVFPWLPWWSWMLLAMFAVTVLGLEGAYRVVSSARRKKAAGPETPEHAALVDLRATHIFGTSGPTLADVLITLRRDLPLGIREGRIAMLLSSRGIRFSMQDVRDRIIAPLVIQGVIRSETRYSGPDLLSASSGFAPQTTAEFFVPTDPMGLSILQNLKDEDRTPLHPNPEVIEESRDSTVQIRVTNRGARTSFRGRVESLVGTGQPELTYEVAWRIPRQVSRELGHGEHEYIELARLASRSATTGDQDLTAHFAGTEMVEFASPTAQDGWFQREIAIGSEVRMRLVLYRDVDDALPFLVNVQMTVEQGWLRATVLPR